MAWFFGAQGLLPLICAAWYGPKQAHLHAVEAAFTLRTGAQTVLTIAGSSTVYPAARVLVRS